MLAVNTERTSAGSETITVRPKNGTLIANTEPNRSEALRRVLRRKAAKAMPWSAFGSRNAGGCLAGWFVEGACALTEAVSVMPNRSQSIMWYCGVPRRLCCTVPWSTKPLQG